MKMIHLISVGLFTILAFLAPSLDCHAGYVKGYYRKNGTYVAPHNRANKSSSAKPSVGTYYTPNAKAQGSSAYKAPKSW